MQKEVVFGERTRKVVGEPRGLFSQGIKVKGGTIIFLSGQAPIAQGKVVGKGDIGAQFKHTLERIKAILEDAGASIDDIVKVVIYVGTKVAQGSKEYAAISEVRKQYFRAPFPVSTLIEVAGFVVEDMLVEVDVIAVTD